MGITVAHPPTTDQVTSDTLKGLGFVSHPGRQGLSQDFGNGNILQLVPEAGEWIVEVWNGVDDGMARVMLPRRVRRVEDLEPFLWMMEFIPF